MPRSQRPSSIPIVNIKDLHHQIQRLIRDLIVPRIMVLLMAVEQRRRRDLRGNARLANALENGIVRVAKPFSLGSAL